MRDGKDLKNVVAAKLLAQVCDLPRGALLLFLCWVVLHAAPCLRNFTVTHTALSQ
jgi:hypothetical protein